MKGYRTLAFNIVVILSGLLALLNNADLPNVVIGALKLFGIDAQPDAVNSVIFVLVGIVGIILRLVTDTPAGQAK